MTNSGKLEPILAAWLGDADHPRLSDDLTHALDALFAAGPDQPARANAQDRLRATLSAAAGQEVYYDRLSDTPLGELFLAVGPMGLLSVDFGVEEQDFLTAVIHHSGLHPRRAPAVTAPYKRQLGEYLTGTRTSFDFPVDLSTLTEFQRLVLLAASRIPHGQVASYGEIALHIGKPGAARAVGQALGRNPVPIVIPCHRVIAADGSLGGYSGGGGLRAKAKLLHLEGARS